MNGKVNLLKWWELRWSSKDQHVLCDCLEFPPWIYQPVSLWILSMLLDHLFKHWLRSERSWISSNLDGNQTPLSKSFHNYIDQFIYFLKSRDTDLFALILQVFYILLRVIRDSRLKSCLSNRDQRPLNLPWFCSWRFYLISLRDELLRL
jgi:hypothetical protein